MGGPTAHPTGVTLASGDPSNNLNARQSWGGSRPHRRAAPVFVLEAGRGLAGGGGIAGWDGQDSWTRSALLRCRGSNVVGGDPFDDGEGDRRVALHCNPGRCGGRVRQEAVDRLQRLLRVGWKQQPWWLQVGLQSGEQ